MPKEQLKKRKTFRLRLTKFELVHLRDLFSVSLPLDLKKTVSQALAESEERVFVETRLWLKIVEACKEARVPLDDDAPDFICAAASAPPIGVFKLAQEPNEQTEHHSNENIFSQSKTNDEEEGE